MSDTPERAQPTEGWTWLSNSRVDHYFREGRSLCRGYAFFGRLELSTTVNARCRACMRKVASEQAKIAKAFSFDRKGSNG